MHESFYEAQRDLDPDFYLERCFGSACQPHFHRSTEIVYVLAGRTEVTVAGDTFTAEADEILFFSEYKTHRIRPLSPLSESIHLILPPGKQETYRKEVQGKRPPHRLRDKKFNRKILPFFLDMPEARDNELTANGLIGVILGSVVCHYPLLEPRRDRSGETVVALIRYAEEHYREKLTLPGVAAHFGYETCYFSRMFKRQTGMPFLSYLNNVRLRNVADKLSEGVSASALALSCGFDSAGTFYRNFKRLFGVSPQEYARGKSEKPPSSE